MRNRAPLTDDDGQVRELTADDMVKFRPAKELLPPAVCAMLTAPRKPRGPNKSPTKERINIRLSPEVVQHFRAYGDGWQTRIDSALKDWVAHHT